MRRLLLTGATGAMSTALRPMLAQWADTVVLSGRRPITDLAPHETSIEADLSDAAQVRAAVEGCDGVLHLGGYSVEGPFEPILQANIVGMYNLYEAARACGLPRILFASSNHAIGYHSQTDRLDQSALLRPDSLYGVSKCFGEALARFYFEKFGQETAIVRIGSCTAKPTDYRMLSSWLSFADFDRLAQQVFTVPVLGCPVIYGASANTRGWWNNDAVSYLGWQPQDNAETFAAEIAAAIPDPDPNAGLHRYQGGKFTEMPIYKANDAD